MDFLTLDFETYYSKDYSLDVMTTEAYIRDPRFEVILASPKFNDTPAFWILPDRLDYFLRNEVDWANTALIHHHAHFDGAILNWHYDVRPALFIDTLSMARMIDGPKAGNSLAQLLLRHGFGEKGKFITYAKGKRYADFTRDEIHDYGAYCCNDTEGTYKLAMKFLPQFPDDELRLIDQNIRLFTEPIFVGDTEKLRSAVTSERARKKGLLVSLGYACQSCNGSGTIVDLTQQEVPCKDCGGFGADKKPFSSKEKFAAVLRGIGIEPATKPSPTSGEPIYAFARNDPAMQALLEDPDELVRTLAEARVNVTSTIIETRAQRFLHCAERGPMPVYSVHAGAHTLRPSGGDSMNWLNMSKRIEGAARPEMSVLRESIQAPPGFKIVSTDSSQGEVRILAWLAHQDDLVEAFRAGRDVYSEHATTIYGRPIDRKRVKEDYIPGQVGKIGILSYGFGSGWYKSATELLKGTLGAPPIQFKEADMITMQVDPSRFLNSPKKIQRVETMPSRLELNDRLIHCLVTEALVQRYRTRMAHITGYGLPAGEIGFWDLMEQVINAMISGDELVFGAHGVMRTSKETIHLPGDLWLRYRGIERDEEGNASYFDGRQRQKLYGSLLTENIVQCLHRLIVGGQLLKIADAGLKVALWPYDEVVCVVPEGAAELSLQFMVETMKREPEWATGLPLAAEGGIGFTYAEC